VINPKRKHWHEEDYRRFVQENRRRRLRGQELDRLQASRWILQHLERERTRLAKTPPSHLPPRALIRRIADSDGSCRQLVSAGLGHILGAGIYRCLLEGQITRSAVKFIFGMKLTRPKEALELYLDLKGRFSGTRPFSQSKFDLF